jgi:hypothetical protein
MWAMSQRSCPGDARFCLKQIAPKRVLSCALGLSSLRAATASARHREHAGGPQISAIRSAGRHVHLRAKSTMTHRSRRWGSAAFNAGARITLLRRFAPRKGERRAVNQAVSSHAGHALVSIPIQLFFTAIREVLSEQIRVRRERAKVARAQIKSPVCPRLFKTHDCKTWTIEFRD